MQILDTVLNAIRHGGSQLQCTSRTYGRHLSDVAIKWERAFLQAKLFQWMEMKRSDMVGLRFLKAPQQRKNTNWTITIRMKLVGTHLCWRHFIKRETLKHCQRVVSVVRTVRWLRRLVAISHCGGPGSRSCQFLWDLWCTKLHWDRSFSEAFRFSLSV